MSASTWMQSVQQQSEQMKQWILERADRIPQGDLPYEPIITYEWTTGRTLQKYLKPDAYSSFPPQIQETLGQLQPGDTWIDVSCGTGEFQLNAREEELIDPNIQLVGADFLFHVKFHDEVNVSGPNRLDTFVLTDIFQGLNKNIRFALGNGFDGARLVTMPTVLYHLQDPLLAIRNASDLVAANGHLFANTFPRVLSGACQKFETPTGEFAVEGPHTYEKEWTQYYKVEGGNGMMSVVDREGNLVPPGELFARISETNPHFMFEYDAPDSTNISVREIGGRVTGYRQTAEPLQMNTIFYARYTEPRLQETVPVYLLARNDKEMKEFQRKGYASVEDAHRLCQ